LRYLILNAAVMEPPLLSESFMIDIQLKLSITKLYFKITKIASIFFVNLKNISGNFKILMKKKGPQNTQNTRKVIELFFCVFLCVLWALINNKEEKNEIN
jgi:hypothetical protein